MAMDFSVCFLSLKRQLFQAAKQHARRFSQERGPNNSLHIQVVREEITGLGMPTGKKMG
jgi:hypothetical protein